MSSHSQLPDRPALPAAGLTFPIGCRTVAGARSRPHDVTLTPDWQLLTPHDLATERIGVALGGVCTCVELVDHVLPAARGLIAHLLRLEPAEIVRADQAAWCVSVGVEGCCDGVILPSAPDAAAHLRTGAHWAGRYGVQARVVRRVAALILGAWAASGAPVPTDPEREPPCPAPRPAGLGLLDEPFGLEELWAGGVHPSLVPGLRADVDAEDRTPSLHALLWAAYAPERDPWLAPFVGEGPMIAGWAVRHRNARDRRHPDERLEWVRAGAPLPAIAAVLAGDAYTLADARALAAAGLGLGEATRALGRWQALGVTPGIDALIDLYAGPMLLAEPPPAASVVRAVELARRAGVEVTGQDAALALVRAGTAPGAAARLIAAAQHHPPTPIRSTA